MENQAINQQTDKIPSGVSDYIKKHFDGSILTEIEKVSDNNGHIIYKVNVSNEDTLYHLKFNSNGIIIEKETEPLFDDDEYGVVD